MLYKHLSYSTLPFFMALIFSLRNVSAITCDSDEHQCSTSSTYDTWCCPNYENCGSYSGSCLYYTTTVPPPDLSPGVAVVIVFVSIFFCILFISCCVRSHQQQRRRTSSFRTTPNPNQPGQRPPRVVHIRPIHNVNAVPPVHIMHEEPPPSYETATRDLPPRYQSPPIPSAPLPTIIDQANLRV